MTAPLHPGQKEGRAEERLVDFVDELIRAGIRTGSGVPWKPFLRREIVKEELARHGFELCEDGANHNPRLRRFFAAPTKRTP